ncbi:MAG: nicotinate phosphoribosyltransferase [Lachnospiraceae bacterium]|nr:nicotinate phosphoribosyltransferase [Lachnospiraceae bacterium]
MGTIYGPRNVAMMMDLYELTMANGYFLQEQNKKKVAFDVFYRKNPDGAGFAVFAGLEQILDYLENMHFEAKDVEYLRSLNLFDERFLQYLSDFRFRGDVYAFPEGSVMYAGEPIITIVADLVEAQMIETEILTQVNHQSLIATKANRIVRAAKGRAVSDFGARRAHNNDAAVLGARACYIGGVNGTATVAAGQEFAIPVGGTMAHSWVMFYQDELTAFRRFAEIYPNNCILLVDTYDVLDSGMPHAIQVFKEMKEKGVESKFYGIRLDSGDLAYLSREARKMLDEAGFTDAKIVVSNSLDEYTIHSILQQGGCIDSFGVGERMITARSEPVFGAVYKLCAVEENGVMKPRIKISENVEKVTNPGLKKVWRLYNDEGHSIADLISKPEEKPEEIDRLIDPIKPWKKLPVEGLHFVELQKHFMKDGKRLFPTETIKTVRDRLRSQLNNEVWQEEQRFENPHRHYLDMTPAYYDMKMKLLEGEEV